ncbi:response regulator transcription factor [Teredinibacter sp. KSP-S5-2]|uniref:response regulator transcription factor n=1 Tax=Teredinibacter sp. KSP-S5-2 TaxID=3034506 RepID=UPI0029351639|nr:response regulator transcription factor [Teredinibacter sp. KSP-S5-2]WNO08748.1 response regulator transcription factor [Teredinibacter sp. KSP-S5-2]
MSLVLLVEDDLRLANLVKDYLDNNGFRTVIESNGQNVARRVKSYCPEIIILDVMLPGKDGLTVCKEIRPVYSGPILMLTARDSDMDQVLGLEFGADDYVIKPAEPRVLLARVRALLRRFQNAKDSLEDKIHYGSLQINTHTRMVMLNNEPVELSSHEYDLLLTLAKNEGKILSRDFLYNEIYSREYDGLDRTLDVRISQLRKKMGDTGNAPDKIKTVWGRGYLFVKDAW